MLLTDEYKCNAAWRQQLQSPLIHNIDMGELCNFTFLFHSVAEWLVGWTQAQKGPG